MAVEIIILQGSALSYMTIQSLAYRDAIRAPPPVSANYVAATESELAQTCKRLLPALGSPEPLNQGPDAAGVAPGGDHSIVLCKY
jgi:hypothetical protein